MMNNKRVADIESKLKHLTYGEIAEQMKNLRPEVLLELLDSKSIKVGDTATDFLARKRAVEPVASAFLERKITTKFGKLRTQNLLFRFGRQYPQAMTVYLDLLADKNDEIADNALLALVMWADPEVIPAIKARQKAVNAAKFAKSFEKACEAILKKNPSLFCPNFSDRTGIWK